MLESEKVYIATQPPNPPVDQTTDETVEIFMLETEEKLKTVILKKSDSIEAVIAYLNSLMGNTNQSWSNQRTNSGMKWEVYFSPLRMAFLMNKFLSDPAVKSTATPG